MVEVPIIELKNICKSYGGKDGTPKHQVLFGIDLSIFSGEFVAIVGTSGSGKSTLMNILGCLDKASSGEYLFAGKNISNFSADELAYLRREAFGFVFQGYHLIPTLDTNHNIQVPAIYKGVDFEDRERKTDELLNRLGLEQRKNHYPHQLSGGQQQRVSIARALVNGGYIILADEPTGALDSKSGIEVMALLKELASFGHTIILITHDLQVASQAQRVVRISDGLIIEDSKNSSYTISKNSFEKRDFLEKMSIGVEQNSSLFSSISEAFMNAWKTLWVNRFRTLLTLLGIIIGVCAVIVLMGVGLGTSQKSLKQMENFGGVHRMSIWGGIDKITGVEGSIFMADIEELKNVENIKYASPWLTQAGVIVKTGNINFSTSALMTNEDGSKIFNWNIEDGEFFNRNDERRFSKVVVLGKVVKEKLFEETSAIGRYILINNIPFRVIGVLKEIVSNSGDKDNDIIVLPFSIGSRQIAKQINPDAIQVYIEDYNLANTTVENITKTLKNFKGNDNFYISNNPGKIQAQQEANKQQNLLITLIGSISLIVGGIGIMNIMLMAVKERTKEIGIRMATGARQSDIKRQFLTEAILVSFIGGVAGVVVAIFIGAVLISLNIELIFSIKAILIAFFSALITGLIFGYIPASKASKLDPVVALNGE